jgi:rod shape determining protein RodA
MRTSVDLRLFVPAFLISLAGLVTMNSFSGEELFFDRQVIWLFLGVCAFFIANIVDWRFIARTKVAVSAYVGIVIILLLLFTLGIVSHGAQSWFSLGAFAIQPSDPAKVILIMVLAKYFSRRHIEIANVRHILVSGVYAGVIGLLVFLQPDFGSAVILFGIWFGMVLVSGISKRHLLAVIGIAAAVISVMWLFVFEPYQKARIMTFLSPLSDIRGAGYNAYQSTIAVGSGELLGKGIGLGSQSKLLFLPEYETDFIFAAFAEEWGYVGAVLLLLLALSLLWRITENARKAGSNFEALFGLGVAVFFGIHILIHAGMNMGLLPVTGIVFPLMSYGGSHLITEWFVLGILSSMRRNAQGARLTDTG